MPRRAIFLLCGLLALAGRPTKSEKCVIAYEHPYYAGRPKSIRIEEGKCTNVEHGWRNIITSIDTRGHVVRAHKELDCIGESKILGLKSQSFDELLYLPHIGFDDNIKSFSYAAEYSDSQAKTLGAYFALSQLEFGAFQVSAFLFLSGHAEELPRPCLTTCGFMSRENQF